ASSCALRDLSRSRYPPFGAARDSLWPLPFLGIAASITSSLQRDTRGISALPPPGCRPGQRLPAPGPASASPTILRRPPSTASSANASSRPPCFGQFPFALARQHHDQPRGLLDAHRRVVHKHGIGSTRERRDFAFAIAAVALDNLIKNFRERHLFAFFLVLLPTALVAHFRRGI